MDKSKNIKRVLYNISPKTGIGSVCIYYSFKKKINRFNTTIKLSQDKWDKRLAKPRRGALATNDAAVVENLYNKLVNLISAYQYEFNCLPPVDFLTDNLEKPINKTCIHDLYAEFIESKKSTLAAGSIAGYLSLGNILKDFDTEYKYKLTLSNMNYSFIEKFKAFSINNNLKNNTINLRINKLKTFVNYLNKKEVKNNINIKAWETLNKNVTELVCLERNELDEILNYKPLNEKEQVTKDIIIFCSHTGIRIGDFNLFDKKWIINNCLEFYPQKTKRKNIKVIIPISKPIREILERTNYKPKTINKDLLSGHIQAFCSKIESLQQKIYFGGELTEKYKILKSHSIGRKTFCNLVIQAGVPIPTLMGMSGHTQIDTVIKSYLDKHQNNLPQLNKVFEF